MQGLTRCSEVVAAGERLGALPKRTSKEVNKRWENDVSHLS